MSGWIVIGLVDPHADGKVHILAGGADDNLFGACLPMLLSVLHAGEATGRFNGNVHPQLFPWKGRRVFFAEYPDRLAIDDDMVLVVVHLFGKGAMNRVVLKEVRKGCRIGEIVNGHDFDFF